jgi:hypothetical protein
MELEFFILLVSPAVLVAVSAFFFYVGLKDLQKVAWAKLAIGISIFLLACGWQIAVLVSEISPFAMFEFLLASAASILAGISITVLLNRGRKVFGLLICIGFPIALYTTLEIGLPYTPDAIIHKNGEAITQALVEYYANWGKYPETLNKLVPEYITDLKEPKVIWGWLYTASADDFTLGYVYDIDKWGYTICKYNATSPEWDCPSNYSTAPFILKPTPWP